jgi:hypothetical protein
MTRLKTITLWIASSVLAILYVASGTAALFHPSMPELFASWEYPDWSRVLAGALAIGAGLTLLSPRVAWRGAVLLGALTALTAFTLLQNGDQTLAILPAGLIALLAVIGYARHPRATAMSRLRAAVDWVAEREMEEARRRVALGTNRLRGLRRPTERRPTAARAQPNS